MLTAVERDCEKRNISVSLAEAVSFPWMAARTARNNLCGSTVSRYNPREIQAGKQHHGLMSCESTAQRSGTTHRPGQRRFKKAARPPSSSLLFLSSSLHLVFKMAIRADHPIVLSTFEPWRPARRSRFAKKLRLPPARDLLEKVKRAFG